jgi:limonene-1,2-epoxide hydrolase
VSAAAVARGHQYLNGLVSRATGRQASAAYSVAAMQAGTGGAGVAATMGQSATAATTAARSAQSAAEAAQVAADRIPVAVFHPEAAAMAVKGTLDANNGRVFKELTAKHGQRSRS